MELVVEEERIEAVSAEGFLSEVEVEDWREDIVAGLVGVVVVVVVVVGGGGRVGC